MVSGRLYCFIILPLDVWVVFTIIPLSVADDFGEFIRLGFLIFWGMRVIESPLSERDISEDEIQKLADYFVLVIDVLK